MLNDSGIIWNPKAVDVRPLSEKLADQGRALSYNDGVFTVVRTDTPSEE